MAANFEAALRAVEQVKRNHRRALDLSYTGVDDQFMVEHLPALPWLHVLKLHGGGQLTDVGMKAIAENLPALRHLNLALCFGVTDVGVTAVAEHLTALQVLSLTFCSEMTDRGLIAIAEHLTLLQHLNFMNCPRVTDVGVTAVAEHLTALQYLNMGYCLGVTAIGIKDVAEHLTSLHYLALEFCAGVNDTAVTAVAEHLTALEGLDLTCCNSVSDEGVEAIAVRLTALQELSLANCGRVTDVGVTAVAEHLTALQGLSLQGCHKVTNISIEALAVSPLILGLRILDVDNTSCDLPEQLKRSSDANAILRHILESSEAAGGLPLYEVKVVVLGKGRWGKTQLVRRLAPQNENERNKPFIANSAATHGFERRQYFERVKDPERGTPVNLIVKVFDFGGQPELHASHRFFLGDQRNVYVLVLNARRSEQDNQFQYWLKLIQHYAPEAPVVIVVSHCDGEPDAAGLTSGRLLDPFDDAFMKQLRDQYGDHLWCVEDYSNANGNNFRRVQEVVGRAMAALPSVFKVHFAPGFFSVKNWLEGHPGPNHARLPRLETYLDLTDFRRACEIVGQKNEEHQLVWLKLLRDLGVVHWVGDQAGFRKDVTRGIADYLFNVDWVKEPVYAVIIARGESDQGGVMNRGIIERLMANKLKTPTGWKRVLGLMEACELCFPIRNGQQELILDHVAPIARDLGDGLPMVNDRITCRFEFLSDHILPQFLGRWFQFRDPKLPYGRDLAVVCDPRGSKCRALLRTDINRQELSVELAGGLQAERTRLWGRISGELEGIIDPEGLRQRPLWEEINPDEAPTDKLENDDRRILGELQDALQSELDWDKNKGAAFHALVEGGWMAAARLTPARTSAWRAAVVVLAIQTISDGGGLEEFFESLDRTKATDIYELLNKTNYKNVVVTFLGKQLETLNSEVSFRKRFNEAREATRHHGSLDPGGDIRRHAVRLAEHGQMHFKRPNG